MYWRSGKKTGRKSSAEWRSTEFKGKTVERQKTPMFPVLRERSGYGSRLGPSSGAATWKYKQEGTRQPHSTGKKGKREKKQTNPPVYRYVSITS